VEWLTRPVVVGMLALALLGLLRPFLREVKAEGGFGGMLSGFGTVRFPREAWFTVFFLGVVGTLLTIAMEWNHDARIIPVIVGTGGLLFAGLSLLNQVLRRSDAVAGDLPEAELQTRKSMHMDIQSAGQDHMTVRQIGIRGAMFFGWLVAYMASMSLVGVLITSFAFIITFMRIEGKEPWKITLGMAFGVVFTIWGLFDQLLTIPWPQSYLGDAFPALREMIPSL
jgi:hypothetical protein